MNQRVGTQQIGEEVTSGFSASPLLQPVTFSHCLFKRYAFPTGDDFPTFLHAFSAVQKVDLPSCTLPSSICSYTFREFFEFLLNISCNVAFKIPPSQSFKRIPETTHAPRLGIHTDQNCSYNEVQFAPCAANFSMNLLPLVQILKDWCIFQQDVIDMNYDVPLPPAGTFPIPLARVSGYVELGLRNRAQRKDAVDPTQLFAE